MREVYIAGNWKMHKTVEEAVNLAGELDKELAACKHTLMIAPPFTALRAVADSIKQSKIKIGAQNMAGAEEGAHTGEISIHMLKDVGVQVVILGHSERRHTYGETDTFINEKVKLAIDKNMEVILCVGETLDEREQNKAETVVDTQLTRGLEGVSENDLKLVTIAYEPVWAIGTGKTATPQDADDMHRYIRKRLTELYSETAAQNMVIQYGGSVKPKNIKELMAMENIDGALVGGASLKADTFVPIALFDK
jgi:triosephosphate isomerase